MSFVISIAAGALLEAVRNRLLWLAGIVVGIALGLAQFLNQVAITESLQIQLALMAALLRVAAVFIVSTFIITSMVREANDKVTDLLLSQAAPRSAYFFGKYAGYALVGIAVAFVFSLPLAFFAPLKGLAFWTVSLCCELLIMTAVSLFCVLSLTQVLSAFAATAGFYLLARSIAAMQLIASSSLVHGNSFVDDLVGRIVNAIALILPALDRMTQTGWLTDSPPRTADFGLALAQTAIYVFLIGSAALFDLYRKNY